jgi:hypothetical protein
MACFGKNLSGQFGRLVSETFVQFFFGAMPELFMLPVRLAGLFPKFMRANAYLFFRRFCHFDSLLRTKHSPEAVQAA